MLASPPGRQPGGIRGPNLVAVPAEGLSPLQRYTLDVDGYLLLERALDRRSVQRLRRAIGDQGLPRPDASLERQRFGQGGRMFTWDPAFGDLVDHPWVLAVLAEVIGPHVRLDHAYGIIMAPGTAGLGLHGPAEPFRPGAVLAQPAGRAAQRPARIRLVADRRPARPGWLRLHPG